MDKPLTITAKKCKIINMRCRVFYTLLRLQRYYPLGENIVKKVFSILIALALIISAFSATAVAFAADEVAVTEITLSPESKTLIEGKKNEFTITVTVKPSDATNKKVSFELETATDDVSVDSESGKVTVKDTVKKGEYKIIVTSQADASIKATFTLTIREGIPCDETEFWANIDDVNNEKQFTMSDKFQLGNEWTKDSETVAKVFPGINYKVKDVDEDYDEKEKYDTISVEYCTPSGDRKVESDWTMRDLTSTFNMRTSGYWLFRYVVKDSSGNILAKSPTLERYAVDRDHPIISLSSSLKTKQEEGLTEGETYSVSTSLDISDSSSTTTNYVVYKLVKGEWTQIYDSKTKEVAEGYEDNISTSGTITPLASDITKDKSPVYKIVYSVVDTEGFFGVEKSDSTEEFHPEITLFVKASEDSAKKNSVDVWKIVLYVIAGLSAVGIIVLLCIKPAKPVNEGRAVSPTDQSSDKNNKNE